MIRGLIRAVRSLWHPPDRMEGVPARYRAIFTDAHFTEFTSVYVCTMRGVWHARDLAMEQQPEGEWFLYHLEMSME